jgi:hypothetical protein
MAQRGRPKIRIEDLVERGVWSEDWKEEIYQMGKEGKQHTHLMEHFDLTRDTFYKLIGRDKNFADAVKKMEMYAQNYWLKFMEDAFIKGESKSINSNLWSLVMRNKFKEDWSEKQYIDHQTKGESINNDNKIVVKIIPPKTEEDLDNKEE